jgi:hypothetical protein
LHFEEKVVFLHMAQMTQTQIEAVARQKGFTFEMGPIGDFCELERFVVHMGGFKTLCFLVDYANDKFTFEKVYNAATDKTTKTLPKIFRS